MTTTWDFGPETINVQAAIDSLHKTRSTIILDADGFILDQCATETWGGTTPWRKRHARNSAKVEAAARGARRLRKAIQNPLDALNGSTGKITRSSFNPITGQLAPALSALACRDLLTRAVYDEQTLVWRAFIGSLHPEDPDWGFTKSERLLLRSAVEANPMSSLKDALATVSEVTSK